MSEPGLDWGLPPLHSYPERSVAPEGWLELLARRLLAGLMAARLRWHRRDEERFLAAVNACARWAAALDDLRLRGALRELREQLRRQGDRGAQTARAFALVREVSARELGLRHFDVQVRGGYALLAGRVAEMDTGEGKTLTATLAAATAALAGVPVHVVTANDYLAARDAEMLGPLYRALGLRVGVIVSGLDEAARRAAYACDITYASNKEIAFDYLRDQLALGRRQGNIGLKLRRLCVADDLAGVVMRGLHFAIVDEADSVLIDEARTPLIISRHTDRAEEERIAREAMQLAEALTHDEDYRINLRERRVELTVPGRERLAALGEAQGGIWRSRVRREESARQALAAIYLFQRDDHYLVRDGRVQIIDEYTGRVLADRSWGEGLHQLVELKEGCPITPRKVPMARMTFQRFFRRYQRLAGMTGTAAEVRGELARVYRLPVQRIPTNHPPRRRMAAAQVFVTEPEKWAAVVASTAARARLGQPVLIGTRSVLASERISEKLREAGLEHVVLSARQDSDEAGIIAAAGSHGCITVATNMAGRGVDIALQPGVVELGGLYVILSERHDSRRIDRQLAGRCGRQGDPGVCEPILSLQDALLELLPPWLVQWVGRLRGRLGYRARLMLYDLAQQRASRAHARARDELLRQDERLGTMLAFSGGNE